MNILIFGASGMLGHKLVQRLSPSFNVSSTIRGGFDEISRFGIFDPDKTIVNVAADDTSAIERAIERSQPDVVINAVGIIKQLPTAKDVITTLTINSIFPHRLAQFGEKYGFRLIEISTDCVFDGIRGNYNETDTPNATDLYGKSKNLGEVTGPNCLTLRSSIIGRELSSSHSLVEWVLSNRGGSIKGFTHAVYSGFSTIAFADIISNLITEYPQLSGLYHIASDPISKFELLHLINQYFDAGINIEASDELRIDRSLDASRFKAITGFKPISWKEMIENMAGDETPYDSWRK